MSPDLNPFVSLLPILKMKLYECSKNIKEKREAGKTTMSKIEPAEVKYLRNQMIFGCY